MCNICSGKRQKPAQHIDFIFWLQFFQNCIMICWVNLMKLKYKVFKFVKQNIVLTIATIAAVITCCLVPPDREYLGYFDMKTLSCLLLTLAVIVALRRIKFFTILARRSVNCGLNNFENFFFINFLICIDSDTTPVFYRIYNIHIFSL